MPLPWYFCFTRTYWMNQHRSLDDVTCSSGVEMDAEQQGIRNNILLYSPFVLFTVLKLDVCTQCENAFKHNLTILFVFNFFLQMP